MIFFFISHPFFDHSGSGGEKPKIPDGIPPRFPKKPSIKQEGDDLILECILEANPLPEITWFRKDKVIKEDSRITWECKKGKKNRFLLTLRIKNPTLKDAGLYRCNAFNSFGDSNANIDLKFESKSSFYMHLNFRCAVGILSFSLIIPAS